MILNSGLNWFLFCIAWFLIFYAGFNKPLIHAAGLSTATAYIFMFVLAMVKLG